MKVAFSKPDKLARNERPRPSAVPQSVWWMVGVSFLLQVAAIGISGNTTCAWGKIILGLA